MRREIAEALMEDAARRAAIRHERERKQRKNCPDAEAA